MKKTTKRRIFWSVTVFVVVLGLFFGYGLLSRFAQSPSQTFVYIDADDTADSVYVKLRPHTSSFRLFVVKALGTLVGYPSRVGAGRYDVGSGQSSLTVLRRLRSHRQTAVTLNIPSVHTMNQLAGKLSRVLQPDSATWSRAFADTALLSQNGLTPQTLPCVFLTQQYDVYWDVTPEAFIAKMVGESKKYWTKERCRQAEQQGLTPQDVVTLASIVDRETSAAKEMPRVAGMYLGRLRKGMRLQADPTVKFALGRFDLRRITYEHLECPSPYNTYRHEGLPPGPICLPSMVAVEAVLKAERHDYIYMCANPDFSGTHLFAKTYEEHLANAAAYARALDERGIH